MVKAILIMWIVIYGGSPNIETPPVTAEYNSPVDCLYALEAVKKASNGRINGICTVK